MPARIPVTAGKKTANTTQKSRDSTSRSPIPPDDSSSRTVGASLTGEPASNDRTERPIAAITKYWVRMANRAETRASPATPIVVTKPTNR